MNELKELSLFSGYGGFSLAWKILAVPVRTVAYVEWEKYPQEIIKARIRDGFLSDAPIFSDISTFRGEQFRGLVDIITAGFPCPPFSVAGLQKGSSDPRNKWPDTLRVIREVRPSVVILENVPAISTASTKRGTPSYGGIVVGQLAEEGYVVRWETLGADDVGAPHRRKRWWCVGVADPSSGRHRESQEEVRTGWNTTEYGNRDVADTTSGRHRGWYGSERGDEGRLVQSQEQGWSAVGRETEGRNGELDDPQHLRLAESQDSGSLRSRVHTPEGAIQPEQPSGSGGGATGRQAMGDSKSGGLEGVRANDHPQGRQESHGSVGLHDRAIPLWPPRPNDTEGWIDVLRERPDLTPALTKEAVCQFRGVADGTTHRVGQLRALGNGVVPSVVALFLRRVGIADMLKGGGKFAS